MKHTEEEKDEISFFRSINLLHKRFFSKEEIDLEQLGLFAKTGKVDLTLNFVTASEVFNVMKETELKKQNILILKLQCEMRNHKLCALLKEKYKDVSSLTDDGPNLSFKRFIEKEVITDPLIYHKRQTGLKKEVFPKIYGYGTYSDGTPYFMEYLLPAQYKKGREEATIKQFYLRGGGAWQLRHIPNQLRDDTILVVGKKD